MEAYTILHKTNISIHVSLGTLAMLLGLVILFQKKSGRTHRKLGQWFLGLLSGVIVTALLGFFLFNANQFLLVLTLVAGYNGYSGISNCTFEIQCSETYRHHSSPRHPFFRIFLFVLH